MYPVLRRNQNPRRAEDRRGRWVDDVGRGHSTAWDIIQFCVGTLGARRPIAVANRISARAYARGAR